MNINIRLSQFLKTISCRNGRNAPGEAISKFESCRNFLIIQRGQSTRHNLMRGKTIGYDMRKKDEIGVFGYFLLGVPVVTFILGTWQIQRRQWKIALIDDLQKRVTSPPAELPLDLSELETMEYCPVKVRGRFLHDKEIIVGPKSLIVNGAGASESAGGVLTPGRSNTGFCIVTPFKLEDRDLTILVNRGWVPIQYKKNPKEAKQAQNNSNEVVEVTGVVRLNETRPPFLPKNKPATGHWFYRDLNAMGEVAGAAPVYIELLASETVRGGPISGQTRVTLRNEHLSYIFTWYSLSAITAWMWHRQFIRKLPLM